jgi:chemotaxis protein histidine kinase CheA
MRDELQKEMHEAFLGEADELLIKSETLLNSLIQEGADFKVLYDQLKRTVHNIKGSGKALGFPSLSQFSLQVENLLIAIFKGKVPISQERFKLLLECNHALRKDIQILKEDYQATIAHEDLVTQLSRATEA